MTLDEQKAWEEGQRYIEDHPYQSHVVVDRKVFLAADVALKEKGAQLCRARETLLEASKGWPEGNYYERVANESGPCAHEEEAKLVRKHWSEVVSLCHETEQEAKRLREAVDDTNANYGLLGSSIEALHHLTAKIGEYTLSLLEGVQEDRAELRRRAKEGKSA